ncbi:MAG: sugar phosphate isomerase/epimerase [Clostridia bacterium]|nr:sugar phosphate isomerase/epimerase [Clostridia bacterium]
MQIGLSSSCFYPELVEKSLERVGESGVKTAEVFLNSECETRGPILRELRSIKEFYGIDIRSIHPFTSAFETIMLFSDYERRTLDSFEFYKKYFYAAGELGARYIVIHGAKCVVPISAELYAERYARFASLAREYGVYAAHENVVNNHCQNPRFMKQVADYTGDDFRMVLDIKQCRRSSCSEFEFIRLLGDKIAQVHISDFLPGRDCIPPGEGEYDFGRLFGALKSGGYNSSVVVELYRSGFSSFSQIERSVMYLNRVLDK